MTGCAAPVQMHKLLVPQNKFHSINEALRIMIHTTWNSIKNLFDSNKTESAIESLETPQTTVKITLNNRKELHNIFEKLTEGS